MADSEVLDIAIQMGKIFNDGDEEVAHRLVAPDFVDHEASPDHPNGPAGYAATARWMRSVWTDATWSIVDAFADGDRAALRVIFSGVQNGEFMGVAATGRRVEVQHIHLYRVTNGQVAEHWAVRDDLNLMRQLGAWPPTV